LDALQRAGYRSFVLSDINNTSACIDMIRMAGERQIKVAVGIDFRNGCRQQYIGIARNNEGFLELNEHLSAHLHTSSAFTAQAPVFNHCYVVYPLESYTGWPLHEHEYLGIRAQEIPTLPFHPARHWIKKMVILQSVSFSGRLQYNMHRLLRAIDTNTLLSKLPPSEQAAPYEYLPPRNELLQAFASYPSIIQNTEALLQNCSIEFLYGKLANKNLNHYTASVTDDIQLLRSECMAGLSYRYPGTPPPDVLQRLEKELEVITQMNFCSYYLINLDIVRFAQRKNFYYVGRGSGANSLVAYLLRITDVDPIELDLYFERFINLYRNNAPDFDMDFSWTDREAITAYIFDRFGKKRTALLGAYSTFQHDAVIRELGKVFGLPADEIDRLQRTRQFHQHDELQQLVMRYSERLKGLPSHLSIHSSGILISEKPIHSYSATFMPPKGFPTTQFSMLEAEDIGLFKFDILSQRGLGKIKDSLELIRRNKGIHIDIHDTARFKTDAAVQQNLKNGQAIGCFYIESPAMRGLLTKLQAGDYLRLVAASSIIRPGVARSGMMREYILRYRHPELREKARKEIPELYDLLEETYGVMVYQEDVIRVAHYFAGLSLAESDYLRRGMSWKFKQRNEFARVKNNFFSNCRKKGHSEKQIEAIWMQIESFANYAFSKGHSASYAVESYQALFLKTYFPLEYMTATLNNGGGFYSRELYLHEARMQGAQLRHPCVNRGEAGFSLQGKDLFVGLSAIQELEQESIRGILEERKRHGEYHSLYDFVRRLPLGIEQMRLLIRANAFAFTGRKKRELLWEVHALLRPLKHRAQMEVLFEQAPPEWSLPPLPAHPLEEAFDEMELFGFPFCSPFDLLAEIPQGGLPARELAQHTGKYVKVYAYLVTTKYTRTIKGDTMYFGTFTDREGQWIDTVHFPESAQRHPFNGRGVYEIHGRVVNEYDFISIEVDTMQRLGYVDRENPARPNVQKIVH